MGISGDEDDVQDEDYWRQRLYGGPQSTVKYWKDKIIDLQKQIDELKAAIKIKETKDGNI